MIFTTQLDPQDTVILDQKIAIPYTTTIPTFTPSYNGYRIIYFDNSNYFLYIYANGGWRFQQLEFSPTSISMLFDYGDGVDGVVTISGNTTLSRDMFYTTLVVDNGVTLTTKGYRVFAQTSITNNGTISASGANGGNGGAGGDAVGDAATGTAGTAGAAASAVASGSIGGTVAGAAGGIGGSGSGGGGAVGANGVASTLAVISGTTAAGGAGKDGGGPNKGLGAAAGAAGVTTQITGFHQKKIAVLPYTFDSFLKGHASGSGGGGGGGGDHSNSNYATGAGGGGGGSATPGAIVWLASPIITNNGTITAVGGNGGNGGKGGDASASGTGNYGGGGGGGGAGGNGGVILLISPAYTNTGTVTVAGGTGGTGGARGTGASGNGTAGLNGSDGNAGEIINLSS